MFRGYCSIIIIIINLLGNIQSESIELIKNYEVEPSYSHGNYSNIANEVEDHLPFGISPSDDYDLHLRASDQEGLIKHTNHSEIDYHHSREKYYVEDNNPENNNVNEFREKELEILAEVDYSESGSDGKHGDVSNKLETTETPNELVNGHISVADENSESNINTKIEEGFFLEDETKLIHDYDPSDNNHNSSSVQSDGSSAAENDSFPVNAHVEDESVSNELENLKGSDPNQIIAIEDYIEVNNDSIHVNETESSNVVKTRKRTKRGSRGGANLSAKQKVQSSKKKGSVKKGASRKKSKKRSDNTDIYIAAKKTYINKNALELKLCLNYELIERLKQNLLLENNAYKCLEKESGSSGNTSTTDETCAVDGIDSNELLSIFDSNRDRNCVNSDTYISIVNIPDDNIEAAANVSVYYNSSSHGIKEDETSTETNQNIKFELEERALSEKVVIEDEIGGDNNTRVNNEGDENEGTHLNSSVGKDETEKTRQKLRLLTLNKIMKKLDSAFIVTDRLLIKGLKQLILLQDRVFNDHYNLKVNEYKAIILSSIHKTMKRLNVSQTIKDENPVFIFSLIGTFLVFFVILLVIKLLSLLFSSGKSNTTEEYQVYVQKKINSIGAKLKIIKNNVSQNNKGQIVSSVFSEDPSLICQKIAARNRAEDGFCGEAKSCKLSLTELINRIEENNEMLVYLSNGLSKCAESLKA